METKPFLWNTLWPAYKFTGDDCSFGSVKNGVWYSFNAQHRHSIDANCNGVAESQDLIQCIQELINDCNPSLLGVSPSLFCGETSEFIPGVLCIVNQANLDPRLFGWANLDRILRLCMQFSFSTRNPLHLPWNGNGPQLNLFVLGCISYHNPEFFQKEEVSIAATHWLAVW